MKPIIFIIITLLNIKLVYGSEETWATSNRTMPTLSDAISGFTTDNGNFRLNAIATAQSNLELSGGYIKKNESAKDLADKCDALGSLLSQMNSKSPNIYALKAFVYPFADNEIAKLDFKIENVPNLLQIKAYLKLANTDLLSVDSAKNFESRLNDLIAAQLPDIKRTGQLLISVGQADDVACAIATGRATIDLTVGVSYEIAKKAHETLISQAELSGIYDELKPISTSGAVEKRMLLNGAYLGAALQDQLHKSVVDFGQASFLKLAGVLFTQTGALQNYSYTELDRVARSLDTLKSYWMPSSFKVNLTSRVGE